MINIIKNNLKKLFKMNKLNKNKKYNIVHLYLIKQMIYQCKLFIK